MTRNWISIRGAGFTSYGPDISGLPAVNAVWEYKKEQEGAFPDTGCSVIFGDKLLFSGVQDHIGCLNIENGLIEWLTRQETESPFFISTNGQYLVVEPCIFNVVTGEVVVNYSTLPGLDYEATDECRPSCNKRWMVKAWKELDPEAGLMVLDLESLEARQLKVKGCFPELVGETSDVIATSNNMLARIDIESGEYIWKTAVEGVDPSQGAGIAVFDTTATLITSDGVRRAFELESGTLISQFQYSDISTRLVGSNYSTAHTERHIYVSGAGHYPHLLGYDYINHSIIFDKKIVDLRHSFCIAGDLIFFIRDLIDQGKMSESELVAIDRYTGEQVWRAKEPLPAAYDVKACGNKIIFSSMSGILRCYQWTEEYISPSRGRAGLRVVK